MSRAFVIGNGPSLKSDQLDALVDEVTFGVNRIHLIYDQTKWRPTHWVLMDMSNSTVYREDVDFHSRQGYTCWVRKDIVAKTLEGLLPVWPDMKPSDWVPETRNLRIVPSCNHVDCERFTADEWHWNPETGEPPVCKMGGSVPVSIQMAAHMGFRTIYLIGMDGNKKGNAENNFISNYIPVDNVNPQKAKIANETTKLALEIAKRECGDRGVSLIDATVGGSAYKVLPEVDFWGLFEG